MVIVSGTWVLSMILQSQKSVDLSEWHLCAVNNLTDQQLNQWTRQVQGRGPTLEADHAPLQEHRELQLSPLLRGQQDEQVAAYHLPVNNNNNKNTRAA